MLIVSSTGLGVIAMVVELGVHPRVDGLHQLRAGGREGELRATVDLCVLDTDGTVGGGREGGEAAHVVAMDRRRRGEVAGREPLGLFGEVRPDRIDLGAVGRARATTCWMPLVSVVVNRWTVASRSKPMTGPPREVTSARRWSVRASLRIYPPRTISSTAAAASGTTIRGALTRMRIRSRVVIEAPVQDGERIGDASPVGFGHRGQQRAEPLGAGRGQVRGRGPPGRREGQPGGPAIGRVLLALHPALGDQIGDQSAHGALLQPQPPTEFELTELLDGAQLVQGMRLGHRDGLPARRAVGLMQPEGPDEPDDLVLQRVSR